MVYSPSKSVLTDDFHQGTRVKQRLEHLQLQVENLQAEADSKRHKGPSPNQRAGKDQVEQVANAPISLPEPAQATTASTGVGKEATTKPQESPSGKSPELIRRSNVQGNSVSSLPRKQEQHPQRQRSRHPQHSPNHTALTASRPAMNWALPRDHQNSWLPDTHQLGEAKSSLPQSPRGSAQGSGSYVDAGPSPRSTEGHLLPDQPMQLDEAPSDNLFFKYPDVFQQKEVACKFRGLSTLAI